jgi:hypothetical protein
MGEVYKLQSFSLCNFHLLITYIRIILLKYATSTIFDILLKSSFTITMPM